MLATQEAHWTLTIPCPDCGEMESLSNYANCPNESTIAKVCSGYFCVECGAHFSPQCDYRWEAGDERSEENESAEYEDYDEIGRF